MKHNEVMQRRYVTSIWKVWTVTSQPLSTTRHLWGDHRTVERTPATQTAARPPARSTISAARRSASRRTDKATQLAYSEWLLAKLVA